MAESKRIFNQAKINRDLDARLLPPGVYRDGLNVNVGESEGGDIGAVENLKGNEEITGQGAVDGVTIGSVRDPNNDKVYWFNTSSEFDAIYEYDQSEDTITTILRDPKNRVASLPTCSPDLQARITDPRSNIHNRPTPPVLPSGPVGGCMDSTANNYNPLAEYSDGSCTYGSNISVTITGDGSFPNSSSPVTLTANVTNANGAFTYSWDTGETTQTKTVSGSSNTITGNVTATDSYGSATDNYSVTFSASAPTTYTKTLIVNSQGVSGMSNGQITGDLNGAQRSGAYGTGWSFTTGITANQGYSYSGNAPVTQQGTHTNTSSVTTTLTGSITANTSPAYNFNASIIDNTNSNISAQLSSGNLSYLNKNSATPITFTSRASLTNGYEWVQVPTPTAANLPTGVTLQAVSGSGDTGYREVTVSGTWQATSSVNPTVTWTGGSAQVIPTRRSVSISSYGGVTTSAECASRSMPITVYFSNTSSSYTGVRNGDTLYTSATGSSTYGNGGGYKTYVADGFGQTLGTVTITNGVVSNSDTSFC
jgi:hypothetical protein